MTLGWHRGQPPFIRGSSRREAQGLETNRRWVHELVYEERLENGVHFLRGWLHDDGLLDGGFSSWMAQLVILKIGALCTGSEETVSTIHVIMAAAKIPGSGAAPGDWITARSMTRRKMKNSEEWQPLVFWARDGNPDCSEVRSEETAFC